MKTKTILLTAVLSLLLAGCAGSNETAKTVSDNSVGENTVVDVNTTQEEIPEDAVSGTVMIPVDDVEESTEVSTEVEDGNTQFFKSSLSESEGFFYLPDGFNVSYSDEYMVEVVKEFNDSVSFDYYDEENDITYYDEIVVADFNNVMNTPFVDSVTYTKAQLMNSGYMYVHDLRVNERDFIVAYSPINREEVNTEEEPFWECYPKTSICALTVTDDNCPCTVEDCTHTEFIEVSCFLNEEMNENDVLFYVESLINNGAFDLVRG